MNTFVGRITVQATPAAVFALYADSAGWPSWDPDVRQASLNGPFAVGSTGTITPRQGPAMAIRLTRVVADQAFDAEARLPGCTMLFEHELVPQGDETQVTHRVMFTGPLAWLFGLLVGGQLKRGIPGTMAGLKAAVEAR